MTEKKTWTILFLWLIGVATGVFFLAEWQYGDVWTLLTMRGQSGASSLDSRRQQSEPPAGEPAALPAPPAAALDAEQIYSQAVRLQTGKGAEQDLVRANLLYKNAADQGHVSAQYNLAANLAHGIGTPPDPEGAVQWFAACAKQDFPPGEYMLGIAYWSGEGIEQDKRAGLEWIRRAADNGHMQAQLFMGIACFEGSNNGRRDTDAAIVWFEKAADNGSVDAMFNLGELHLNGVGVPKNSQTAIAYYRAAADKGLTKARERLATLGHNQ